MIIIFGIVHYTFLLSSIIIAICFILTFRKYLAERNIVTLIFSLFLLTYVVEGLVFFTRGLFVAETLEDLFLFRITLILPMVMAMFYTFFIIIPMLKQKEGTTASGILKALLVVIGIETLIEAVLVIIGGVELTFIADELAHYTIIPFVPIYAGILITILSTAAISVIFLVLMVVRESESFYRTKALLLLVGWILIVVGQLMFLTSETSFLNPPLGGVGVLLTAIALLRQSPT